MSPRDWIDLSQDSETGIETLRAHFEGHAYDPHWHDSYLVGVTEQGVQQFNCRRQRHSSTQGKVFMLEPGEIHDGEAPEDASFTYSSLYIDPQWLMRELRLVYEGVPCGYELHFDASLAVDAPLAQAISAAFKALQSKELRIVRQSALDALFDKLTHHVRWRMRMGGSPRLPSVALRARDYLHAHMAEDVGLDDLARVVGTDRFRLTRAFKAAFGMPPHAYFIQLRLARARRMLALGVSPAAAAADLGFADQSHLGRWFRRAYGLTPAHYRRRCSNVPD